MSLKYDDKNHPFIDLGNGFQIILFEDRCKHGKEFESKARLAINETPENVKNGMEEIRRLVAADGRFNLPFEDDWYVNTYLRVGEYDPQETYSILQATGAQKAKNWEYFGSVASIRHVFDEGLVWIVPERDEDGAVIIVVESGKKWNPSKVSLVQLNTAVNAVVSVLMQSEEAQLHGYKMIFDVDGLSMTQIVQFTPHSTAIMLDLMDRCSPIRVLHAHTINNGMVYNVLFSIMKPLMSKKMREKQIIHGRNRASLAKYISPKVLPPRYGGTSKAPEYDGRLLGDLMMHYDEWMQSMYQYR
ncbi:clavesin-1-like isoform X2 [Topomyia yanbarensis]|uniref:clavesin-1-like isoform X2 n=1 Tax=Topomyia yanbarensis TaxID=2498891 RepID=UPI00273AE52E|nr:clavesin-1-like isoform X2 [Topomyia yanbarensis]